MCKSLQTFADPESGAEKRRRVLEQEEVGSRWVFVLFCFFKGMRESQLRRSGEDLGPQD